jgi:hypothetical protein
MKRRINHKFHALTVAILLAALACYGASFDGAGLALFFAGAVLELWFWIRAVQGPPRATHRGPLPFRSHR